MKAKDKSKIVNRKALALALGRDVSTLCRWLSDPGWPVNRQGPWTTADVSTIKAWRDRVQQALADDTEIADVLATTDRGDSDSMRQAKLAVLKERAAKLRIERQQLENRLIDREAVERGQVQRIEAMEPILLAEFRSLCNSFASG